MSAAAVVVAMEYFCKPTNRRRRRYPGNYEQDNDDNDDDNDDDDMWADVQLSVPVEDFLGYHWDWNDLQAFLTSTGGAGAGAGVYATPPKRLWITEHTFLVVDSTGGNMSRFRCETCLAASVEQKATGAGGVLWQQAQTSRQALTLVQTSPSEKSTAEFGIFWRALATSNSVQVTIEEGFCMDDLPLTLPSFHLLSKFLRESPSLRFLEFNGFTFREEHCHALATLQRTDLEVTLSNCVLDPQDEEGTFIELFRHNQAVTEIKCCVWAVRGNRILSALSGNHSVKRMKFRINYGDAEMRSLLQALTGNIGIEHLTFLLDIDDDEMSDETWCLLFRSLSTHPHMKFVTFTDDNNGLVMGDLSAESKSTRMNAILRMLQHNTVVHTLKLPDTFYNEEVYQNSILPRLERNRTCFSVQRRAVKRADPSIRPQLLGRALHVVRYNPDLVFRFLSENVPAFVRTEKEEEEETAAVAADSAIPLLPNEPATIVVSGQKRKYAP
jgi:hypothetical protein